MGLFDRWMKKPSAAANTDAGRTVPARGAGIGISLGSQTVPLSQRLGSIGRDRFGLLPHESLLLHYAPNVVVGGSPSAGFWQYRYDVIDPGSVLRDLASRGYLEAGPASAAAEKKTLPELKEILAARGAKAVGKKADLVARVIETLGPQELDAMFSERHYALTATGQAAVEGTPHILYVHRHQEIDGLDIFRFAELYAERPATPWRDLVWTHLDQRGLEHAQAGDWGLYANTRRVMATMHAEEGRHTDAIAQTAEVLHWDLSGTGNNFKQGRLKMHAEAVAPHIAFTDGRSIVSIPPGLVTNIFAWAELADMSRDQLWRFLNEQFQRHEAQLRVFTPEELAAIVFMQHDGSTAEMHELHRQASDRFRKTYGL